MNRIRESNTGGGLGLEMGQDPERGDQDVWTCQVRDAHRLLSSRTLAVCARNSIALTEVSLGVIRTLVITRATGPEKITK